MASNPTCYRIEKTVAVMRSLEGLVHSCFVAGDGYTHLMPEAGRWQKEPLKTLSRPLPVALVAVTLTVLMPRMWASWDRGSDEEKAFRDSIARMSSDLLNNDSGDFLASAIAFRRKVDADDVPFPYRGAAFTSSSGDIQALVHLTNANIDAYLRECVNTSRALSNDERSDCERALHTYVGNSINELDLRLKINDTTSHPFRNLLFR